MLSVEIRHIVFESLFTRIKEKTSVHKIDNISIKILVDILDVHQILGGRCCRKYIFFIPISSRLPIKNESDESVILNKMYRLLYMITISTCNTIF